MSLCGVRKKVRDVARSHFSSSRDLVQLQEKLATSHRLNVNSIDHSLSKAPSFPDSKGYRGFEKKGDPKDRKLANNWTHRCTKIMSFGRKKSHKCAQGSKKDLMILTYLN